MHDTSHIRPKARYPKSTIRLKPPFPPINMPTDNTPTRANEILSQMVNLTFLIISGIKAVTSSTIIAPIRESNDVAVQKIIQGISIVIICGFFCLLFTSSDDVFCVFPEELPGMDPKYLSQSIMKEKSPSTVYKCLPNASGPLISPLEMACHTSNGVLSFVVVIKLPSLKTLLPSLPKKI